MRPWSRCGPARRRRTSRRELSWDLLVDGCERVVEHAERNGIVLAFEPEPGMLVETLADYERLQERLGHPAGARA